jgi:hypothetical protein
MRSLLKPRWRESIRERAAGLRPESSARWGRFTAPQMLAHAIQSLRMMTGELPVPAERVPWVVRHAPLRQLLIYVLPFPKGLPTSAALLSRPAAEPSTISAVAWAEEQRELAHVLETIGARAAGGGWPEHPASGPMDGRDWGVLQYRHIDHHLRQFGL